MLSNIWLWIKGISGCAVVPDICKFSKKWFDIHDYKVHKGGDGEPKYFYTYTCWNCRRVFTI